MLHSRSHEVTQRGKIHQQSVLRSEHNSETGYDLAWDPPPPIPLRVTYFTDDH
jgi:hypothetical protein